MRLVSFHDESKRHRVGAAADGLIADLKLACRGFDRNAPSGVGVVRKPPCL
jgi:hypothetical protein